MYRLTPLVLRDKTHAFIKKNLRYVFVLILNFVVCMAI